jgi:phosphatidylglycerophosphate synthase
VADGAQKNLTATALFGVRLPHRLARWLSRAHAQSDVAFGAFLDPVADKLMVAAALILLVGLARVEAPIAVIIIGREIAISALREWMAKIGKSRSAR